MSSGSRLNSSNPNVPSGLTKTSTHQSTLGVDGLASTLQDLSRREDMLECYLVNDARSGPEHLSQHRQRISSLVQIMLPSGDRSRCGYICRDALEPFFRHHACRRANGVAEARQGSESANRIGPADATTGRRVPPERLRHRYGGSRGRTFDYRGMETAGLAGLVLSHFWRFRVVQCNRDARSYSLGQLRGVARVSRKRTVLVSRKATDSSKPCTRRFGPRPGRLSLPTQRSVLRHIRRTAPER